MTLTFYTSVAKGLKVKAGKFLQLRSTLVEVTGEKLVGKVGWGVGGELFVPS